MSLQCIFNRFSVYVDVVSNENVALFWIQSLSVCKGISFLITELLMFSLAQRPVGSVSIIEPEAPGVLLRFSGISAFFTEKTKICQILKFPEISQRKSLNFSENDFPNVRQIRKPVRVGTKSVLTRS